MSALTVIALIWSWHLVWMVLVTLAVGQAAYRHSGWPVSWPVSGRWILALLFATWVFVLGDVTRAIWSVNFDARPNPHVGWMSVVVRALPVPVGPWLFWRQWRHGLANDDGLT